MNNQEMAARDLSVIWHPCTQMKDHEFLPMVPIRRGEGVYLEDFEGKRYIDAISSWWVNLFGHAHPYINAKIVEQLGTLEHVILAGFTHEQVIRLSERLVRLAPQGLTRCFYADNGSSAVEVALKMSFHYHLNNGEHRSVFLSLRNSYHGETIGALSVGDVGLYKETYAPLLIRSRQVSVPRDQSEAAALDAVADLERCLASDAHEIAALILEPLVQGAGGMHMYHPRYLIEARRLCSTYGVHLIADEIMTGFGRTGSMFACDQAGIAPDFMTLSKGLTGGYLPLSVVMTTDAVYEAFYCDYALGKAFLHSHSYTGNALACAAANATLDLFESKGILKSNQQLSQCIAQGLKRFEGLVQVKEVRQCGMIAAVELADYSSKARIGLQVYRYGLDHGVLLRPLGNVIYFMPPYIMTEEQIETMIEVAYAAISALEPVAV
ncbi:MAG: adenosylmethionine--8-amino-7-oxononanoate transaminase [Campylobacterales bacterium]|nr:adenosylmethionine--8-amino-7-oxononanoate transaminase [Campylobacterales bacterium]